MTTRTLLGSTRASEADARSAIDRLLSDGRLTRATEGDDALLQAAPFVIPDGASQGWEAAVFDHYQALSNAVAEKLRRRASGSDTQDDVGGTTLHFGVYPGHPHQEAVHGMLRRVRADLNALWNEVLTYNKAHPVPVEARTRVTFYFGQNVIPPSDQELAAGFAAPNATEGKSN